MRFNSLWFSNGIWGQRSGSTFAQTMACCLTSPSHYLVHCGFCGIRMGAIYLEILMISICKIELCYNRPKSNSLWPSDTIWQHRSGSTLVQVMVVAWRHQAITWTNVDLSSVRFRDIQLRGISQDITQPSITKFSLKITYPKFHLNLPGANESINTEVWMACTSLAPGHQQHLFWPSPVWTFEGCLISGIFYVMDKSVQNQCFDSLRLGNAYIKADYTQPIRDIVTK